MISSSVQTELPRLRNLPTMYDLPSESPEEPGLPDEFHLYQSELLRKTFHPPNWEANLVFSACDLNLYYDLNHLQWYKRPDWFGVVGVSRLYEEKDLRLSYVIWQEQISPFIVVELLSPGTESEDLGETTSQPGSPPTKWQVYEQILRVPYYCIFSRYTNQLQAFHLVGDRYEAVQLQGGNSIIPELKLRLGIWEGSYENIERLWLRWFTESGELILTDGEQAFLAEQRALVAQQQALEAQQQALEAQAKTDILAAKLRELGINPDDIM